MPWIESAIAAVSPKAAYRREAWRQAHLSLVNLGDVQARRYAGADRSRLNSLFGSAMGSNNGQLAPDLATLRAACRQMFRDNPYALAGLKNLTAQIVGDGIEARALHSDPKIAALGQKAWADFANSKVDGRNDFYQLQKLGVRATISDGETLLKWSAVDGVPDMRCELLDAAFLDTGDTRLLGDGGRVVMGVEVAKNGDRAAYHLFKDLPGDSLLTGMFTQTVRTPAADVDHCFETLWNGQVRGVPWFHAAIRRLADIDDVDEAQRIKEKIAACLAVFRTPGPDDDGSPLGGQKTDASGRTVETLSPGMIINGKPGETVTAINPPVSSGGEAHKRGQLMAVAASLGIPYHVLSGDVSQANYSSLRAAMVVFWALLDDWVWNTFVPFLCQPAFERVMRREALRQRQPKLLEVKAHWTPAPRAWVDPLKDITAQIMEVRAGFESLPTMLAARGRDWRAAFAEQAEVNGVIDQFGLAFDTDPRRLNGAGALQAPTGYVLPKNGEDRSEVGRVADFILRTAQAMAAGDPTAVNAALAEAGRAVAAGDPVGAAMAECLQALTQDF